MASSPSYDPNLVERHFGAIARRAQGCELLAGRAARQPRDGRPVHAGLDLQGRSRPRRRSTAAQYTPDSTFDDTGYCIEYGKKVSNFADQSGPEVFGHVNFTQALQHSINAVFCEIGKKLGPLKILDYAKRFGFYSDPPLETPSSERQASGLYNHGRLFLPARPEPGRPGPARVRTGADAGDAAADGDARRRDRERRHRDAAVRRRPDHDAEGRDRHAHAPEEALAGGLAGDRSRADEDDGGGRPGGHGHGGADLGRAGRRARRARRRPARTGQHDLVHRLRAGERAEGRRRRRPREPARHRRRTPQRRSRRPSWKRCSDGRLRNL